MFDETISDSDYQVIADSIQNSKNVRRKANLNRDELNTCLISHVLKAIQNVIDNEKRIPSIAEMMDITATVKEELSLSLDGYGLNTYKDIMTSEQKLRRYKKQKDKELEVE